MAIGALARALKAPISRVIFTGGREVGEASLLSTAKKSPYGTQFERNPLKVRQILDNLGLDANETEIIVGDARGLDRIVFNWAKERGYGDSGKLREFRANWEKYPKRAGFKRNYAMAMQEPDLVIAFPGGKGTEDMIRIANDKGIPVLRINNDEIADDILNRGVDAVVDILAKKYARQMQQARAVAARPAVAVKKLEGEDVIWSRVATVSPNTFEASSKAPASERVFRGLRTRNDPKSLRENESPLSALHMVLSDGKTIEWHYQVRIKGYRSIQEGKGKPARNGLSDDQVYQQYKQLWRQWFDENPDQLELVARVAGNRRINDFYAARTNRRPEGVANNQARAVAEILDESGLRNVASSRTSLDVPPVVMKDFNELVARSNALRQSGDINPSLAASRRDEIFTWATANRDAMTSEMAEEMRGLWRWFAVQADESYHTLVSYMDELAELQQARLSGLTNKEAREEFLEIQTRFKEFIRTEIGERQTNKVIGPEVSKALAAFSKFSKEVGATSSRGTPIATASTTKIADEILGEVDEVIPVVQSPVTSGGTVADRLDKYADWTPDRDTVQAAREGIGYNYLGVDHRGVDTYELSAEDVLQIAARNQEAVQAGATRRTRTEQEQIDRINTEAFSDEASLDRFPDRQSPLALAIENMVDQRNRPDSWEAAAVFRREMEKDVREGNYRVIRRTFTGTRAIPGVDKNGKPLRSKDYEVVQKVRDIPGGAQQVFGTEVFHNGRRLTPDEVLHVMGSCPRCGIVYPRGTPGLCGNGSCLGRKVLNRVAQSARPDAPESFVSQVLNFIGEGPSMTAARQLIAESPVKRVVVLADPRYRYRREEIVRMLELLDLPYDVRVIVPNRGGAEREILQLFRNRNINARMAAKRNRELAIARRASGGTEEIPEEVFIPDLDVELVNPTYVRTRKYADDPEIAALQRAEDAQLGLIKEDLSAKELSYNVGVSKENVSLQASLRDRMEPRRATDAQGNVLYDWGNDDVLVMTFGDTVDIDAISLFARRARLQGQTIRTIAVGPQESSQILSELRPDMDVIRYIVNNINPEAAGVISESFAGLTTRQMLAAQARIRSDFKGYIGQRFGGPSWLASPFDAYARLNRVTRLEKSIERISEALAANPNMPSRVRASMTRTLNSQRRKLERELGSGVGFDRMFDEGIFIGPIRTSVGGSVDAFWTKNRGEVAESLIRQLESGKNLQGRRLTADDQELIIEYLVDKRRQARVMLMKGKDFNDKVLSDTDKKTLLDFIARADEYIPAPEKRTRRRR